MVALADNIRELRRRKNTDDRKALTFLREHIEANARDALEAAVANGLDARRKEVFSTFARENPTLDAHDRDVAIRLYDLYRAHKLDRRHEIIGEQGCGDLTMNSWSVAYINVDRMIDSNEISKRVKSSERALVPSLRTDSQPHLPLSCQVEGSRRCTTYGDHRRHAVQSQRGSEGRE